MDAYAEVNSLYGPGNSAAWLLCCLSVVLTNLRSSQLKSDKITYDLVIAMLYTLWAAFEACIDSFKADATMTKGQSELFINKMYAPMTICMTYIWLILPLLLMPAMLQMNGRVKQSRYRNVELVVVGVSWMVLCFGIGLPFGMWTSMTFEDCEMAIHQFISHEGLICVLLVLMMCLRPGRSQALPWRGYNPLLLALCLCCWRPLLVLLLSLWFPSKKYKPVCNNEDIRSLWWLFSVLPKTRVPMSGDQLFALVCGILTLARSVKNVVEEKSWKAKPYSWSIHHRNRRGSTL